MLLNDTVTVSASIEEVFKDDVQQQNHTDAAGASLSELSTPMKGDGGIFSVSCVNCSWPIAILLN